jgi:hypothetical protein
VTFPPELGPGVMREFAFLIRDPTLD